MSLYHWCSPEEYERIGIRWELEHCEMTDDEREELEDRLERL